MTRGAALILLLLNAALSAALIAAHARWLAPPPAPPFAVLDVAELYRLKEREVTTVLMKTDVRDDERREALRRAQAFGAEIAGLIERLPAECRCLILARGAVIGPTGTLPDLTPLVRQRLGL